MRIKKAQTGAGVPKGYVKGEMTGKLYKKSEMDKRKKDFASELNKASIFGKKDSIKPVPKKKMKSGGSLGMKSVKAGYDKNPGVTRADIIVAAKKEAKSGAKMKKQAAKAIAMKKAGKSPKKAMGGMKMMMGGGKCKYGC